MGKWRIVMNGMYHDVTGEVVPATEELGRHVDITEVSIGGTVVHVGLGELSILAARILASEAHLQGEGNEGR